MEGIENAMPDAQLRLLEWLIHERAWVAGEVLEIQTGVWVIHGWIPVEGDVIMAEFTLPDEAEAVLHMLRPNHEQLQL